ncbi:MAG: hypothetical protein WBJ44_06805 [Propionicimonas sp.]
MATPTPRSITSEDHDWVLAAPFRAHLVHLQAVTGLPWAALAAQAGVSPTLVDHLVFGRRGRRVTRLAPESAARLLAVTSAGLAALSGAWVPTAATAHRLELLVTDGCSVHDLADWCRLTPTALLALPESPRCTRLTELLMSAACLLRPRLSEPDVAAVAA